MDDKPAVSKNTIYWKILSTLAFLPSFYLLDPDHPIHMLGLLVLVLAIHELGHYFLMRAYGYRELSFIAIPFFGAAVTGYRPKDLKKYKEILVYLAGPLPGILIGIALTFVYRNTGEPILRDASLLFLILNIFNLIPFTPFDGGHIARLLITDKPILTFYFYVLSFVGILSLAIWWESWILGIVAVIPLRTMFQYGTWLRDVSLYNRMQAIMEASGEEPTDEEKNRFLDLLKKRQFLHKQLAVGKKFKLI